MCDEFFPRGCGTGLPQNSPTLAEQVETIDKKYLLERRGAVSDDVVMTKLTKALQIQIGAVERYNRERAVTVVVAAFAILKIA